MSTPAVAVTGLRFRYREGDFRLDVPELTVASRERVAVTGPSGCGKTTLLHLIAGIVTPLAGTVHVGGRAVTGGESRRRAFRVRHVGLVFQDFQLLPYLTVLDNILLPCRIGAGLRVGGAVRDQAAALAERVGLAGKLRRHAGSLSHGEQQRVAVCRAVVLSPALLLADEPTGNLDAANAQRVLDLLLGCAEEADAALMLVTHERALLDRFDRVVDFSAWRAAP